jgi:sulfur-carrier protein
MKLNLRLFSYFTKYLPPDAKKQTMMVEVPEGTTVAEVLSQVGVPLDKCRLVMINGVTHSNPAFSLEMELQPGDTLAVLPNVF